jgi:hypothetical protein|nr:MAG TPA: hypothetical protein [Caudoviricetes sp.]
MTEAVLRFIRDAMASANIPYEFMEYTSAVDAISAYWVGEYTEEQPLNEDGMQKTQFILTGTGKGSWSELEKQKEKIKKLFPANGGRRAILDDKSGVAVFYGNAFPVPTGDGFMKRLQINLTVKEWKVN